MAGEKTVVVSKRRRNIRNPPLLLEVVAESEPVVG